MLSFSSHLLELCRRPSQSLYKSLILRAGSKSSKERKFQGEKVPPTEFSFPGLVMHAHSKVRGNESSIILQLLQDSNNSCLQHKHTKIYFKKDIRCTAMIKSKVKLGYIIVRYKA